MTVFEPDRPVWVQVTDILRGRIESGEYPPKHKITVRAMVEEFGIADGTAKKVLAHMRDVGLITTVTGLGSFVAQGDSHT